MYEITELMAADHRSCDDRLVAVEQAVSRGNWDTARRNFNAFSEAVNAHFSAEETVLFPLFEQRTGFSRGPTQVMRGEHQQILQLLAAAREALEQADGDEYLGDAETLLILIQQHNAKEENVLYPLCDQQLADQLPELVAVLRERLNKDGEVAG